MTALADYKKKQSDSYQFEIPLTNDALVINISNVSLPLFYTHDIYKGGKSI